MLSLPGEGIRGGRKRRLADASLVLLRYWRGIGSIVMFLNRKIKSVPPARGGFSIPEGRRVYAIGDIHGRDDLFAQMIEIIRTDNAKRNLAKITLILLGDLVDRGPHSAGVVNRAMRLKDEFPDTRLLDRKSKRLNSSH